MHRRRAHGRRFGHHLHLRIWCAVLAGLVVAGLLAAGAWRLYGADTPREIVLTAADGSPAGNARLDYRAHPGAVRVDLGDGRVLFARWRDAGPMRAPFGFAGTLLLIVLAVGAAAYPVARRLTRRLEQLQVGVDALGEGDLAARVPVRGHDEVAHLAERFNHAAARIESLVAAHKTLLANASHELRSPLARIRMGLELLERGDPRKVRDGIARDVAELDLLIEEILLASRLEAGATPADTDENVDLTALAAEECARVGADLDADGIVTVEGVPRLLRRALRNLIENAVRHGGGATPDVAVARDGGAAVVSVCDRGPGVPEDERERIFEAFYRLRGASEADGGVGLGLSLVHGIALRHGGRVECLPRAGGGACFRLTLPLPPG